MIQLAKQKSDTESKSGQNLAVIQTVDGGKEKIQHKAEERQLNRLFHTKQSKKEV